MYWTCDVVTDDACEEPALVAELGASLAAGR